MIPVLQCKHGYLYIVACRNANIGIYDIHQKGFRISRFKFDRNYEFVEYHWDTNGSLGTARPLKKLFKPPAFSGEKNFLDFMNDYYRKNHVDIWKVVMTDKEYGRIMRLMVETGKIMPGLIDNDGVKLKSVVDEIRAGRRQRKTR